MNIRDNYVSSAFFGVPQTILGTGFFLVVATVLGEAIFASGLYVSVQLADYVGGDYWGLSSDLVHFDLITLIIYSVTSGALSGVGLIFFVFDAGYIYRLLNEDESCGNFIFAVAGNQIGLSICAGIPTGEFLASLLGGIMAMLFWGLLFYGYRTIVRKFSGPVS